MNQRPLVFDLDGSFSKIDVVLEILLSLLISKPISVLRLIAKLRGSDLLQFKLALLKLNGEIGPIPIEPSVAALQTTARQEGRRTVLATASPISIANHFSKQVGGFDEVFGSQETNLKGPAKRSLLDQVYGVGNYDYVGDSRADLAVWESARKAYFVGSTIKHKILSRKLNKPLIHIKPKVDHFAPFRSMRPSHWVKNSLVFLAPILALDIANQHIGDLILAFFGLSLLASSLYIVNDIADVRNDRWHPTKLSRPIASGALGPRSAIILSLVSSLGGYAFLLLAGGADGVVLGVTYAVISYAYSAKIKQVPLLDVVVLSGLYVYRILLGALFSYTPLSYWLIVFAFFTFLSLALLKRSVELHGVQESLKDGFLRSRRGYGPGDAQLVRVVGISLAVATVFLLSLYVQARFEVGDILTSWSSFSSLGLIPLWSMWILRLWREEAYNRVDTDPVKYALTDFGSLTLLAITASTYFVALLGRGGLQ